MGQRKYEKGYKVQAVKLARRLEQVGLQRNWGSRWMRCTAGRRRCGSSIHYPNTSPHFAGFRYTILGLRRQPLPCKNSQPLPARAAKSCPLRKKFLSIRLGHDMMSW